MEPKKSSLRKRMGNKSRMFLSSQLLDGFYNHTIYKISKFDLRGIHSNLGEIPCPSLTKESLECVLVVCKMDIIKPLFFSKNQRNFGMQLVFPKEQS